MRDGGIEPDPVIEAYKKDIDRTLIRENLKLSVEDRLRNLMALQRFAEELRRAGKAARRERGGSDGGRAQAPAGENAAERRQT